jgi:uncharacterized protein YndB with AHSA1/START domain
MSKTQITAEEGTQQIVITRDFAAPRDLVFRAYTDPELLARWMGPRRLKTTIERYDVRDGGVWRFTHEDEQGNSFGFHGVHHGTPTPERFVRTFEFEGAPGHVSLETATLSEHDGVTTVRVVSVFQSVEDRDAMVAAGMETGVVEGYERLDEVLASLTASRR